MLTVIVNVLYADSITDNAQNLKQKFKPTNGCFIWPTGQANCPFLNDDEEFGYFWPLAFRMVISALNG